MYSLLRIQSKKTQKIKELHPDFCNNVDALEKNILRCANVLYGYYLECFVKKQKAHKDFPVLYREHMYELHKVYLHSFRANGFRMNKTVVLDYVNNMALPLLARLVGIH